MKKFLRYAAPSVLGVIVIGAGFAAAHDGWREGKSSGEHMERVAEIIGVSPETLQEGRAEGLTIHEIAEAEGVDLESLRERMHAEHEQRMRERLEWLVSEGEITQDEADEKLATMQDRWENRSEDGPMGPREAYRKGFRHGFKHGFRHGINQ
jgi:hypothetical protein